MVLQKDVPLKIWGWASPGEKVKIVFNAGKMYQSETTADATGSWSSIIPPQHSGGPYSMQIKGSNEITIIDILIGDVWLCSGQSNMEMMMSRVKYKYAEEIKQASNPKIRQFTIPDTYNFENPSPDIENGKWISVNPGDIFEFSAVAYFFAKNIFQKYGEPIGLLNAALGGSPAQAWISEEGLKTFPGYYQEMQLYKNREMIKEIEIKNRITTEEWYALSNKLDDGIRLNWKDPGLSETGWQDFKVPNFWNDTGTDTGNGIFWFRKSFAPPSSMLHKQVKLELGRIVDADSVFINGFFAGSTAYQYPPRIYIIQPGILKAGTNTIAVRIVNSSGKGGFIQDKPYRITTEKDTVELSGSWKYKKGVSMNPIPEQTVVRWKPGGLFNGMIAPLLNYSIKGFVWYQGESNTANPKEYRSLMQGLIEDWRKKWSNDSLPFLFVQLPNFGETVPLPAESNWAELREAQLLTLSIKNTAMAVTIDIGEWNDIHPLNKETVGKRLFFAADFLAYGNKQAVYSGPVCQQVKRDKEKLLIQFSHIGTGLIVKGGHELSQFSIAGADGKFVRAHAKIKDNLVEVWSPEINHPIYARYAWADNPEGANLYNREGLPASPFRLKIEDENSLQKSTIKTHPKK